MFIGMIWARWETPPSTKGPYTSGFEEEFHLSRELHQANGYPHRALFFKDVDPSKLSDPGPELSKVLAFKTKIMEEKEILFESLIRN